MEAKSASVEKLIISDDRKKKYGEVGTPAKVVDDMLGLVKEQAIKDGSYSPFMRYFEPACGWGNFLEPILRDKLDYLLEHDMWDIENIKMALGSIYAVDIQADNVNASRNRLLKILGEYRLKHYFPLSPDDNYIIYIILTSNIIIGDTINKPEAVWFCFYEMDSAGIMQCIKVQRLADMLGDEHMKELKKCLISKTRKESLKP